MKFGFITRLFSIAIIIFQLSICSSADDVEVGGKLKKSNERARSSVEYKENSVIKPERPSPWKHLPRKPKLRTPPEEVGTREDPAQHHPRFKTNPYTNEETETTESFTEKPKRTTKRKFKRKLQSTPAPRDDQFEKNDNALRHRKPVDREPHVTKSMRKEGKVEKDPERKNRRGDRVLDHRAPQSFGTAEQDSDQPTQRDTSYKALRIISTAKELPKVPEENNKRRMQVARQQMTSTSRTVTTIRPTTKRPERPVKKKPIVKPNESDVVIRTAGQESRQTTAPAAGSAVLSPAAHSLISPLAFTVQPGIVNFASPNTEAGVEQQTNDTANSTKSQEARPGFFAPFQIYQPYGLPGMENRQPNFAVNPATDHRIYPYQMFPYQQQPGLQNTDFPTPLFGDPRLHPQQGFQSNTPYGGLSGLSQQPWTNFGPPVLNHNHNLPEWRSSIWGDARKSVEKPAETTTAFTLPTFQMPTIDYGQEGCQTKFKEEKEVPFANPGHYPFTPPGFRRRKRNVKRVIMTRECFFPNGVPNGQATIKEFSEETIKTDLPVSNADQAANVENKDLLASAAERVIAADISQKSALESSEDSILPKFREARFDPRLGYVYDE